MNKLISTTLYRKYRPDNFNDVIGQKEAVSVLENSIKKGEIGHAYLFSGARGLGKTTLARIFAKEIGTAPEDIYELDGASNRRIDEIRNIRDVVNILPLKSSYKVYIIDEVHMLTKEAFNALLKTLEEPPSHIIFILATTEKHKLPETIISRCQTFELPKANINNLIELIERISKKEKIVIDKESKEFLATLGSGSFRDTLTFLQKTISAIGKNIKFKEVQKIFKTNIFELENSFLEFYNNNKYQEMLDIYYKLKEQDIDFELFLSSLIEKIRVIILSRYSKEFAESFRDKYSKNQLEFLISLSKINSIKLKELINLYDDMVISSHKSLFLEIFLLSKLEDK